MTFDRERPYLGENRLQAWLEAAVAAGVILPDDLEARRQRWRALAVPSVDGTGEGWRVPPDRGCRER